MITAPPLGVPPVPSSAASPAAPPRRAGSDRHSRRVGLMKIVLPGVGLGLLATALLWPSIVPSTKVVGGAPRDPATLVRRHEMSAPKYVGTDDRNRPYQVEAKAARLANARSETVLLDEPKANMTLENDRWVAMTARRGEFNQKTRIITLDGDVNLFHDANYTFRTERATVDTIKGRAWGGKPVFVTGPKATIEAQGFEVEDKGQIVRFTGRAKVMLYLDSQDVRDVSAGGNKPAEEKKP
jgi:lipopolysaccharide export system protein LptC